VRTLLLFGHHEHIADDCAVDRYPAIGTLVAYTNRTIFSSWAIFAPVVTSRHRNQRNCTMASQLHSLPEPVLCTPPASPTSPAAADVPATETLLARTPPRSPADSTYSSDVENHDRLPDSPDRKQYVSCDPNTPQGTTVNADSKLVGEREASEHFQREDLVVHDSPPWAGAVEQLQQQLAALVTEFAMLEDARKKRRAKFDRLRDASTMVIAENKALRDEMNNLLEEIDDLYDVTECCLPFIRDYNLAIRPFTLKRKRDDLEDDPVDEEERDAKRHKAYHASGDDDVWVLDQVSDDDLFSDDA
jgi:hypothetical protein